MATQRSRRRVTLQMKLTALMAVAILLTTSAVMAASAWSMMREVESLIRVESETIGSLMAEAYAGEVRFGKTEKLMERFESLHQNADGELAQILAYNAQGELLAAFPEGATDEGLVAQVQSTLDTSEFHFVSDQHAAFAPVVYGKSQATIGLFALDWSEEHIQQQIILDVEAF